MAQGMNFNDRVTIEPLDGGVAVVRLSRPEKLNALDMAMFDGLVQAGQALFDRSGLRCVVLVGEGRGFSAGLDLSVMSALCGPDAPALTERTHGNANLFQQAAMQWRELPVPVIAVIHGVCFGGALQLAGGADMRVAAPDARLSVAELKWGIVPDMGGFALWNGLVRRDVLRRMTYTAQEFSGLEAERFGFVTELASDPVARAMELARQIADLSPHAIRAAKALFASTESHLIDDILLAESQEQHRLTGSFNQQEAMRSQMEARDARFRDV